MSWTAWALGPAVGRAFAQQSGSPPAEPEEPILRVSVNLVQVDAVVTDSDGHQVTNLTTDDFDILEDGRPQKITAFSYVILYCTFCTLGTVPGFTEYRTI
jgi:hypothetical protein